MHIGINSYTEKVVLMAAGIGTTRLMSGLRKNMDRGLKMAPDFKKAKGQFRPVFFSYFQFPDPYKSNGSTAACIANSPSQQ